jgi:hypothetical protein
MKVEMRQCEHCIKQYQLSAPYFVLSVHIVAWPGDGSLGLEFSQVEEKSIELCSIGCIGQYISKLANQVKITITKE